MKFQLNYALQVCLGAKRLICVLIAGAQPVKMIIMLCSASDLFFSTAVTYVSRSHVFT